MVGVFLASGVLSQHRMLVFELGKGRDAYLANLANVFTCRHVQVLAMHVGLRTLAMSGCSVSPACCAKKRVEEALRCSVLACIFMADSSAMHG